MKSTPPMGWNSWNTFYDQINEALVLETADAMVAEGLRDLGYRYVIIDDCWAQRERVDGRLTPDPEKFPHGMRALADGVHARGMKLGLYSCCGVRTCAGYPGSFDNEYRDAEQMAGWGIDYLQYDNCNRPSGIVNTIVFAASVDTQRQGDVADFPLRHPANCDLSDSCSYAPCAWQDRQKALYFRASSVYYDYR